MVSNKQNGPAIASNLRMKIVFYATASHNSSTCMCVGVDQNVIQVCEVGWWLLCCQLSTASPLATRLQADSPSWGFRHACVLMLQIGNEWVGVWHTLPLYCASTKANERKQSQEITAKYFANGASWTHSHFHQNHACHITSLLRLIAWSRRRSRKIFMTFAIFRRAFRFESFYNNQKTKLATEYCLPFAVIALVWLLTEILRNN